jgi:hypothetical protein
MEKSKADTHPDSNNDPETAKLTVIPCIKWILFLAVIHTLHFTYSLNISIISFNSINWLVKSATCCSK